MKILSRVRLRTPLPSIEMRTPDRRRRSVQANDVNWDPWRRMAAWTDGATMLHGHDVRRSEPIDASFSASTQKSASPRHGPRTSGGPWLDVRDPPRQDHAGVPVHDRHQGERGMSRHRSEAMPSAATHRQIGDVHTPDLIWPATRSPREPDRGKSCVPSSAAGVGLLVDRHQTHQRISRRMRFSFTLWPFSGLRGPTGATVPATAQVPGHLTDAKERRVEEPHVDQPQ